jgi:hypothetical protein
LPNPWEYLAAKALPDDDGSLGIRSFQAITNANALFQGVNTPQRLQPKVPTHHLLVLAIERSALALPTKSV